jgi:hypothetical protein
LSPDAPEAPHDGTVGGARAQPPAAEVSVKSRREIVKKRIVVWLLFGAIFGLMPLFALALKEVLSPAGFSIDSILKNGDLFIISAVLSAGALGELLAAGSLSGGLAVILSGFFCLACFAGNTIAYVTAGGATASQIAVVSIWFFPPTLIVSAICVGMAAYG